MNSNKNWGLKIDELVYKRLEKFPKKDATKIIEVLQSPDFNPYSGDIKKIKGEGGVWRRRIGAYRISYEIEQDKKLVHVFWVERRTSKTYK